MTNEQPQPSQGETALKDDSWGNDDDGWDDEHEDIDISENNAAPPIAPVVEKNLQTENDAAADEGAGWGDDDDGLSAAVSCGRD